MKVNVETKFSIGDVVKYKTGSPGNTYNHFGKIKAVEVCFIASGAVFIRYYFFNQDMNTFVLEENVFNKIGEDWSHVNDETTDEDETSHSW